MSQRIDSGQPDNWHQNEKCAANEGITRLDWNDLSCTEKRHALCMTTKPIPAPISTISCPAPAQGTPPTHLSWPNTAKDKCAKNNCVGLVDIGGTVLSEKSKYIFDGLCL